MTFRFRASHGALAALALLGAAFFPDAPTGAPHRAFGTLTGFGIGNASGTVALDGTREFATAADLTVDGRPNRCDHAPTPARRRHDAPCPTWPSGIVLGKTTVVVRYFRARRPDLGVDVDVAADVSAVTSPADDAARAAAGDTAAFRALLAFWPMADGGAAERLSDRIGATVAGRPETALVALATLPASDQAAFRRQPEPFCGSAARAAVAHASPSSAQARAWRTRLLATCPKDTRLVP